MLINLTLTIMLSSGALIPFYMCENLEFKCQRLQPLGGGTWVETSLTPESHI